VNEELDQILILPSQLNLKEKIEKLREKKAPAGRFARYESKESLRVLEIIREVAEEGPKEKRKYVNSDDAVAGFTKDYDGVELKPEEFRVSKEDLKKAHDEIDIELLESICQAECKEISNRNLHRQQKTSRNKIHTYKTHRHLRTGSFGPATLNSNNDSGTCTGGRC